MNQLGLNRDPGLGATTTISSLAAAFGLATAGFMLYMAYEKPPWAWTYLKVIGFMGLGSTVLRMVVR